MRDFQQGDVVCEVQAPNLPSFRGGQAEVYVLRRSLHRFMVACPGVHLSGGSLVRGLGVHLSEGSLVRGSLVRGSLVRRCTCPGGSLVRTCRRFGVATPRGSHSQGYAVLLKYIHAVEIHTCSAEIYMGEAVLLEYCGEISPVFSL